LFGEGAAKRAQLALPMMKWSLIRAWDRALHDISRKERLRRQPTTDWLDLSF